MIEYSISRLRFEAKNFEGKIGKFEQVKKVFYLGKPERNLDRNPSHLQISESDMKKIQFRQSFSN